jgi:hypothetical protein
MSWFKKTPPPPPRKSYLQPVLQIAVPIVFMIMIGLLGIVYNGLAEEVKTKADKQSLRLMIEHQESVIESNQETLEKQQNNIEKQQAIMNQTLQTIQILQMEQKAIREEQIRIREDQKLQPPSGLSIMTSPRVEEKPPLSPSEFKEYMKLSPEEKEAFRKLHPAYQSLPK